ncbi:YqgE/AlgH family protein [Endozoicomonas sp. OPT23]|uniref:YqgE/AlgH family protein n=1 Tax=Endozoicomonas sp. OPT23 TaxID=2072845 RepID=UPI00129B069C|nr:YqgE/AlgH family protein [Endozoicomonas sp. OPT23]MRI31638.1 YqgE/AlgH family protein [Endozoicomonas sp. OPT23]
MSSITQSLKNHFLIAMPRLADPSFAKTLTLICEHSNDGALGIIINRPTELKLHEVFAQIGIEEPDICSRSPETVFSGGPIAKERGFVLHSGQSRWESSLRINNGLQLTSSRDILFALANDEGPEDAMIALGYAGWGKGQLEQEMSDNSWLTCTADNDIIFDTPFHHRLDAAASLIGVNLQLMSDQVGHA